MLFKEDQNGISLFYATPAMICWCLAGSLLMFDTSQWNKSTRLVANHGEVSMVENLCYEGLWMLLDYGSVQPHVMYPVVKVNI